MIKKVFGFVLMISVLIVTSACGGSNNVYTYMIDESFDEFIIMGTSADYAPYEYPKKVNGKQTLVGIDIEIAKVIAKSLGKNLKIINKGFDFLLDDLDSGKLDFVLAGLTPTDKRKEQVDFSMIYYEATQVILTQTKNASKYLTIDDLNQKNVRIGAQIGSIQQNLAESIFTDAQKQYIQSVPDLVLRLSDNQINGVILERPVAEGYVKNIQGLFILDIEIGDKDGGAAVAVKKGNQSLLEGINQVLEQLINSGEMTEIIKTQIELNG